MTVWTKTPRYLLPCLFHRDPHVFTLNIDWAPHCASFPATWSIELQYYSHFCSTSGIFHRSQVRRCVKTSGYAKLSLAVLSRPLSTPRDTTRIPYAEYNSLLFHDSSTYAFKRISVTLGESGSAFSVVTFPSATFTSRRNHIDNNQWSQRTSLFWIQGGNRSRQSSSFLQTHGRITQNRTTSSWTLPILTH